jgi:hypothetical protein
VPDGQALEEWAANSAAQIHVLMALDVCNRDRNGAR